MQRGLLVEFSCNPHSLLDSPLESFTRCEIICPWVTSGCYNTAPAPVIIDGEPKYEISWIVDSKIDHWRACKLLYKVIWLEYEDTGDESEWISISGLTYATDLVSDFHIAYPTKPSPLPLSWTHCCICPLPPCIFNGNFPSIIFSIFCSLIFINLQLPHTFRGFLFKLLFILILVFFLTHTFKS